MSSRMTMFKGVRTLYEWKAWIVLTDKEDNAFVKLVILSKEEEWVRKKDVVNRIITKRLPAATIKRFQAMYKQGEAGSKPLTRRPGSTTASILLTLSKESLSLSLKELGSSKNSFFGYPVLTF